MDYKKILMRVTIGFVCVILFLTFFSRTLADLHVPRVTLEFVRQGNIHPEARSSGLVRAADTEIIFAPAGGRITQLADIGESGVLFTLTSDMRTLSDMLERAEHDRRLTTLNLERAQSELEVERQQLVQMPPAQLPTAPTLNLFEYDLQLENNERSLLLQLEANTNQTERAQENLETQQILFAAGVNPRQQLTDAENELSQLETAREQIIAQHNQTREQVTQRRDQAIANFETATSAYTEATAAARSTHQSQIDSRRGRITQLEIAQTAHELEMERIEAQIYELAMQIADGGVIEVRQPGAVTVTEHMAGISEGAVVQEGAAILRTALANNRFYVEASFPQIQDFIDVGQNVEVTVGTERLTGRTARIVPQGGRNNAIIEVQSGSLRGGELVTVVVSGGNTNHPSVIPLSALREDQNGYFVLFVQAVPQRFGSSYYVRAFRVNAGRRDTTNVAITTSWGMEIPDEPIIINSDIPVGVGQRVRLVGG
ncbi:MAG: hypothetical protein FWB80_13570 [Defluviitaleaceae bacterium]|nr:hypothetical protein [Defluviitaleaceae bacterium]